MVTVYNYGEQPFPWHMDDCDYLVVYNKEHENLATDVAYRISLCDYYCGNHPTEENTLVISCTHA